ncbi:MAG: GGDEF domain-containing protein [Myxococcota bacterium]
MFGKRKAATAAAANDDKLDARQVLADLIRHFGNTSIGTPSLTASNFRVKTFAWARHLATGCPPPNDVQHHGEGRAYSALRRELIHLRSEEMQLARETDAQMRDMVIEFATQLRDSISSEQDSDVRISKHMRSLSVAAIAADVHTLKDQVASCAAAISEILEYRERQHQATLEQMGERIALMRDALAEARERMSEDSLTGLFNRSAFDEAVSRLRSIAFATGQPLSLLMIDIDHFKKVNDTHGHQAGDAVLREFSKTMIRAFPRRNDFLARYGGEEFVVMLPDTDSASCMRVAERFLETVRNRPIQHDSKTLSVTCSIGISTLSPGDTVSTFIKRADDALYQAKHDGRDRVAA